MAFFYLKPINWLWGWTHIIYVPAVWYYFPTATACRVYSQRSTKFTMYRYLYCCVVGLRSPQILCSQTQTYLTIICRRVWIQPQKMILERIFGLTTTVFQLRISSEVVITHLNFCHRWRAEMLTLDFSPLSWPRWLFQFWPDPNEFRAWRPPWRRLAEQHRPSYRRWNQSRKIFCFWRERHIESLWPNIRRCCCWPCRKSMFLELAVPLEQITKSRRRVRRFFQPRPGSQVPWSWRRRYWI